VDRKKNHGFWISKSTEYCTAQYIWEITALSNISKSFPCTGMALGATTPLGKVWVQGIVCKTHLATHRIKDLS
jgi:hypothetical protein